MNIRCSITYSMSPYRNTLWAPREHDLEAECALTQKNGIGVEGTLIPMSVYRDPEA